MVLALPFSFRQPYEKLSDVKLNNDFGTLVIDLNLHDNFENALNECNENFGKMKVSLLPWGSYFLQSIPNILPYGLMRFIFQDLSSKITAIYTNVVASTQPYCFDGKRDLMHYFLLNGFVDVSTGISLCTIGNRMSLGLNTDLNSIANPQEFCNLFD